MVDAQGFLKGEAAEKPLIVEELNEQKESREQEAPVFEAPQEEAPVVARVEQAKVVERPHAAPVVQTVQQKDPQLLEIEEILSHNMTDLFLALPPDRKQAFKEAGEEAAVKIQYLVDHGKATARKIFDIIRHWLRGLPMINRFFLEQEAKMKTDEVIEYVERKIGNIN